MTLKSLQPTGQIRPWTKWLHPKALTRQASWEWWTRSCKMTALGPKVSCREIRVWLNGIWRGLKFLAKIWKFQLLLKLQGHLRDNVSSVTYHCNKANVAIQQIIQFFWFPSKYKIVSLYCKPWSVQQHYVLKNNNEHNLIIKYCS